MQLCWATSSYKSWWLILIFDKISCKNAQFIQNLEQLILYVDAFCHWRIYSRQSNCQFQASVHAWHVPVSFRISLWDTGNILISWQLRSVVYWSITIVLTLKRQPKFKSMLKWYKSKEDTTDSIQTQYDAVYMVNENSTSALIQSKTDVGIGLLHPCSWQDK